LNAKSKLHQELFGDVPDYNHDTFRSIANTGACDLIALEHATGRLCRVEVKTAHRSVLNGTRGELKYVMPPRQKPNHDVLALVVLKESTVEFRPDIKEWFLALEQEQNRLKWVG
jgi:hypothetical protein